MAELGGDTDGLARNGANGEVANPMEPSESLKRPPPDVQMEDAHPPQPPLPGDSMTTRAEKAERNDLTEEFQNPPPKRVRLDGGDDGVNPDGGVKLENVSANGRSAPAENRRGMAPIKAEYLVNHSGTRVARGADDDAAEAAGHGERGGKDGDNRSKRSKKGKGQNTARTFGSWRDAIQLCNSRTHSSEFAPIDCTFGDSCRHEHNIRKYLTEGKREDLTTFGGVCPIWNVRGECPLGWKCRFVGSHSQERQTEDGRQELVLVEDEERKAKAKEAGITGEEIGTVNVVSNQQKRELSSKKVTTPKSETYLQYVSSLYEDKEKDDAGDAQTSKGDARANFVDGPLRPSEKRRIYYGAETPVLAPLTTQGNLPFRRLCVEFGAQVTWSEMAMGLPIIQGQKSEWALMKAHQSEATPPTVNTSNIIADYDNSKDLKFGAQIAANKPWLAAKTTEILTSLCPSLRAVDLNCGCPIDLVYRQGAGSALLENHGRLEKMLRGMNYVSGDVPITAKIRMGSKDNQPTAEKLVHRFAWGGGEAQDMGDGPCGVAAITLHGRSRQQRYTKQANWEYIADCAAIVDRHNKEVNERADTADDADPRDQANTKDGKMYFIGNGDCYSHVDYYDHIKNAKVDSVMVARGALIKPWVFEEIEKGQYLDKSAAERLEYVEKFAKYGLEAWGSDEIGVGTTRRFLLEWLSFACRYVPIGLLEHLPPKLNDRPPAYRGRDDLETLLASDNYKDWIKISEMFLGPCHKDFRFEPKHKSNSYEIEAEG